LNSKKVELPVNETYAESDSVLPEKNPKDLEKTEKYD
jgi:hypothetical protein